MRYLLHDVFLNSVKKHPDKIAVIEESGAQITYAKLNDLSNQYAQLLLGAKTDIRSNPYVGVMSQVSIASIAGVLATLKIGCSYVPLDEYSPTARLLPILKNTKLDVIIADPSHLKAHEQIFNDGQLKLTLLTQKSKFNSTKFADFSTITKVKATEPKTLNQVCDDLAYVLHSSGSTGVPKGIMLTHRNARTFVDWMQKEFMLKSSDLVASRAPFKFDLSVFDIFNTFKVGATLVCYDFTKPREDEIKHKDYVELLLKHKVTHLYTTPSTFIVLNNKGQISKLKNTLKTIMYAGEPFPIPQIKALKKSLPKTKIANIYGPTETNIITYFWIKKISKNWESIPLGDVVDDTEILVVNNDTKTICEPDAVGELWCRGGTVTIGYLGIPDKTKENLVLSPFHTYPTYFWRTGDYGYRDHEGCLWYRGRRDHMVKVMGHRIEIGEVENTISSCDGINEFVVVAKPDPKYTNRLICYYNCLNGKKITENQLKSHAAKSIPKYMVPFRFILLEVLPKTSSGKVDRVLLASLNI